MSPKPLLRTEKLTVGYAPSRRQRQCVREDIDVALEAGELVCVLGPNGAGKSTLLRTLAGMQPPLGGRIELVDGRLDAFAPQQRARRIGVVLPERVEVGLLTAYALVALGRYPHTGWTGRLEDADEEKIRDALRRVGIEHLAERDVASLSDGERQKVMIARALAQEPMLLVLDEPTAFLDLPGRVEIMRLLRTLAHRSVGAGGEPGGRGRAVLLSTHDLDLALRTADRLWLLLPAGELAAGAPEDLVLDGAFQAAFRSDRVEFDVDSGSFRIDTRSSGTVALRGEGMAVDWTARALERTGFRVLRDGESGESGETGGLRVEVVDRGGERGWRLDDGEATSDHRSIAELLGRIAEPLGRIAEPLGRLRAGRENDRFAP